MVSPNAKLQLLGLNSFRNSAPAQCYITLINVRSGHNSTQLDIKNWK